MRAFVGVGVSNASGGAKPRQFWNRAGSSCEETEVEGGACSGAVPPEARPGAAGRARLRLIICDGYTCTCPHLALILDVLSNVHSN